MCPVMRKRKLFSTKQKNRLSHIRNMIKHHIWCPPSNVLDDDTKCMICGEDIPADKKWPRIYAVWVGFICLSCSRRYKEEIEELSNL